VGPAGMTMVNGGADEVMMGGTFAAHPQGSRTLCAMQGPAQLRKERHRKEGNHIKEQ
jgi:hypothetical protein